MYNRMFVLILVQPRHSLHYKLDWAFLLAWHPHRYGEGAGLDTCVFFHHQVLIQVPQMGQLVSGTAKTWYR